MTPEKLKRGERQRLLLDYVQDSIRRLEAGEIHDVPTYQGLADQFGYQSPGSLYTMLKKRGLTIQRSSTPRNLLESSTDLSWLLGTLSGRGYIDLYRGYIYLPKTKEEVFEKYRLTGETLFGLNAYKASAGKQKLWGRSEAGYRFYSVEVARFLGDLRFEVWDRTILSNHPWILDNADYTWGFITGFFEVRGSVYTNTTPYETTHRIKLSTDSLSGANLLSEMLARQGIKRPHVERVFRPEEKIKGVVLQSLEDIKLFAEHVHSVVLEKDAALEYYRSLREGDFFYHSSRDTTKRYTREDLIEEWKKIGLVINGNITARRIGKLRREGKTEISGKTYANRFGQGNFVRARKELWKIIEENVYNEQENNLIKSNSSPENKKRYQPPTAIEEIARLEKALSLQQYEIPLDILVDLQGRPLRASLQPQI